MDWQEHIDCVLDGFDFERVHRCMVALDWEWYDTQGVPCIMELRRTARKLLRHLVDEDLDFTASGGFRVVKDGDMLSLRFEVADNDNEELLIMTESEDE